MCARCCQSNETFWLRTLIVKVSFAMVAIRLSSICLSFEREREKLFFCEGNMLETLLSNNLVTNSLIHTHTYTRLTKVPESHISFVLIGLWVSSLLHMSEFVLSLSSTIAIYVTPLTPANEEPSISFARVYVCVRSCCQRHDCPRIPTLC